MSSFDPSPSDPGANEEFWAMARRVRRSAEEELAEIEYETERAELKRQDMMTVALSAMMEGERWQVSFGTKLVDGHVVHVGQNYLGLQDRAGNLHDVAHRAVQLVAVVAVDAASGRAPITFRPATFRARLLSLEEGRELEMGGRTGGWSLLGTIESVNADHVLFRERSGQRSIAPIEGIGYISRSAESNRRGHPQSSGMRPRFG